MPPAPRGTPASPRGWHERSLPTNVSDRDRIIARAREIIAETETLGQAQTVEARIDAALARSWAELIPRHAALPDSVPLLTQGLALAEEYLARARALIPPPGGARS